jgi:hypothetical protein
MWTGGIRRIYRTSEVHLGRPLRVAITQPADPISSTESARITSDDKGTWSLSLHSPPLIRLRQTESKADS